MLRRQVEQKRHEVRIFRTELAAAITVFLRAHPDEIFQLDEVLKEVRQKHSSFSKAGDASSCDMQVVVDVLYDLRKEGVVERIEVGSDNYWGMKL